ncbi:hypothetical protein FHT86_005593 [Rhizobium sp. BK313]|nr:hypothetical protein [Rhizobium sp. BK313]
MDKSQEDHFASLIATQTAILAKVCNLLVSKNIVSRTEFVNEMHKLLSIGLAASPQRIGPLNHLLALIDQ